MGLHREICTWFYSSYRDFPLIEVRLEKIRLYLFNSYFPNAIRSLRNQIYMLNSKHTKFVKHTNFDTPFLIFHLLDKSHFHPRANSVVGGHVDLFKIMRVFVFSFLFFLFSAPHDEIHNSIFFLILVTWKILPSKNVQKTVPQELSQWSVWKREKKF